MSLVNNVRKHKWVALALALMVALALLFVGKGVVGKKVRAVVPRVSPMVHSVVTTGRVRPLRIRLAPLSAGTIRELPVEEGTRVSRGQLLLQLDDQEARAALSNAEAVLAQATAGRRKIRTITRSESDEAVTIATTQLSDAERDLSRVRKLLAAGTISNEQVEDAETTLSLAKSALRSAKAQQQDIRSGATFRNSQATIQQAQAEVAIAKAKLGYTRLVAPADGVVILRDAEVGDAISGNSVVLEIAATTRTELVVEPDERNLSLLKIGQPALASTEAFADQVFKAELSFIAPVVDRRRGTIEVRLLVPDPPAYLRPDMTVSVDIEVAKVEEALVLPLDTIVDLASNSPYVLAVKDKRVVRLAVETGIRDTRRVQITAGVAKDELIVLHPQGLSPGDRVRPSLASK